MRGRPRGFNRDEALETALTAFRRRGFDGVSIAELSASMKVAPPSIYAAFGNKAALFEEASSLYCERLDSMLDADLDARSGREAMERVLESCLVHFSEPGSPPGCMIFSEPLLAERRRGRRQAVQARLERAAADHEIDPSGVADFAFFIDIVLTGMADQARAGATRDELRAVAARAMAAWPDREL